MQLYKISNEFEQTLHHLTDMSLSEQEIEDNLAGIKIDFEKKAVNIAAVAKNLELEVSALKQYESDITDRRKNVEQKIIYLKNYLLTYMIKTNILKIHDVQFDISVRKNPHRLDVLDESKIDPKYFKEVFIAKLDKVKLKEELKANKTLMIEGVKLVQDSKIVIK